MNDTTFSLNQILESVNEMRAEVRAFIEPGSEGLIDIDADMWKPQEDRWFEDCEFDPREN